MSDEFKNPYPDYDVLDKWHGPSWNDQTRSAVHERLHDVPKRSFLSAQEWATLEAICGRLLPQPDRPENPVPITPFIDQKLEKNQGEGYRYQDMPPLRRAWQQGLAGIEQESQARFGHPFTKLDSEQQDELLTSIQEGDVSTDAWEGLPAKKFFKQTLLKTVVGVYYAHPSAWNEIGFGGPASPRGYVRKGFNQRDPWEAKESRERD